MGVIDKLSRVGIKSSGKDTQKSTSFNTLDKLMDSTPSDFAEILSSYGVSNSECNQILGAFKKLSDSNDKLNEMIKRNENQYKLELKKIKDSLQAEKANHLVTKNKLAKIRKRVSDSEEVYLLSKEDYEKAIKEKEAEIAKLQQDIEEAKKSVASVTIADAFDYGPLSASDFAEKVEAFIMGDDKVEKDLKKVQSETNTPELKNFLNTLLNFEYVDESSYESLTHDLKEDLDKKGIHIPSLRLIADSAIVDLLKSVNNPFAEVSVADVMQIVSNYGIDPNPETETAFLSLIDKVNNEKLKGLLTSLRPTDPTGPAYKEILDQIVDLAKSSGQTIEIAVPAQSFVPIQSDPNAVISNIPWKPNPVYTHEQYLAVEDSYKPKAQALKLIRSLKPSMIKDCSSVEFNPELDVAYVTEDGLKKAYTTDNISELALNWPTMSDEDRAAAVVNFVEIDDLIQTLVNMGYLATATNGLLYRPQEQQPWVSEIVTPDSLTTFVNVVDPATYRSVSGDVADCGQATIMVSDSEITKPKSAKVFKTYKSRNFYVAVVS